MNYKVFCRTAPGAPGLLFTIFLNYVQYTGNHPNNRKATKQKNYVTSWISVIVPRVIYINVVEVFIFFTQRSKIIKKYFTLKTCCEFF